MIKMRGPKIIIYVLAPIMIFGGIFSASLILSASKQAREAAELSERLYPLMVKSDGQDGISFADKLDAARRGGYPTEQVDANWTPLSMDINQIMGAIDSYKVEASAASVSAY